METSKFHSINLKIAKYFIYFLPVLIIDLYFLNIAYGTNPSDGKFSEWQVYLMALIFIVGVIIQLYFTLLLIFSKNFRELSLSKLSGFRERDEREEEITRESARSTHIIILATLITMFFFNSVTFEFGRREKPLTNGKTGYVSIGMNLNLFTFNNSIQIKTKTNLEPELQTNIKEKITYNGLPLNTQQLILLLIMLQLYFFRRSFSVRSQL